MITLLEMAQHRSEELLSTEEELRQAMQELTATQEELNRKLAAREAMKIHI